MTTKPRSRPFQYPVFGLDTEGKDVLALNERLAELGYLPVAIASNTAPQITKKNLLNPPQVAFQWKFDNVPAQLKNLWAPDVYTEMTRAAVIEVEYLNHLAIDGIAGASVWQAILKPNAVKNPYPYTYVLVTKNPDPEMLHVWQAGKWVYESVVNTGIAGAPSTDGTFAVYQRYLSQTMKGKNPDGTKYVDPGVPYVNYYNGSQAIHGFVRQSYGYPQSVGCVELPVDHAKVVWSLLYYGTLVTVEGQYVPPLPKTSQKPSIPPKQAGQSTRSTVYSTYGSR
ncbi:L,D-transpeptidase family protein [Alicyclobacillus acidiphilus]|uniref:L,D-transpeptidase family protein n=1 Tax=Alicyclobacillus acidiphilus TaxID=182455 RepID=UPI00146FD9F3|nr:L,D-transpeptidase family protein [Alicyclobacillus acidiphilus]